MARASFAEVVRDAQRRGRIILMDGPMGTELVHSGLELEKELTSEWNVKRPDAVKVVYEDYTNAGAEVLLTNTFSSHLAFLRGDDNWREQVSAAIELARQPEWDHLYCVGSVGTVVDSGDEASQVILLLDECDATFFETQTRLDKVKRVLDDVRQDYTIAPLIVSFSFSRLRGTEECWVLETTNGATLAARDLGRWAQEQHLFLAIGANCGTNLRLDDYVKIARDYHASTDLPLLIRPGITPTIEAEFSAKEYAARVKDLADAGVTLLGGCCGTTPAHIAALRKEIDRLGLSWQE